MEPIADTRPLTRGLALAHGITDHDLRLMLARDGWHSLRRGHYLPPALAESLGGQARHRLLVEATLPRLAPDSVLSHQSAAVLHRIDLWRTPLDRVHVTRRHAAAGRRTARSHCHAATLADSDLVEIDGLPVTSLARTIADLGCSLPFEESVAAGDNACFRYGLDPLEVLTALEPLRGARGVGRARSMAKFIDGRSESVGESRSRVILSRLGVPTLELQHEVFDERGFLLGRTDFALPHLGVLGEFDGRIKYGRCLRPGQDPGDAVFNEKQREDRLRDEGWQVVRWVWRELSRPDPIVRRFDRAIARGTDLR